MKNLLALLGFFVVVFAVLGYFRSWYTIDWKTGSDGKVEVKTQFDTQKIGDDSKKGLQKAGEKIGSIADDLKNKDSAPRDFFGAPIPEKSTPKAILPAPQR